MTENEAIAVRFIENIKNHAMVTLEHIAKEEPNVSTLVYKGREKKADTILAMVEELQQYRALEKRLAEMFGVALSLEDIIDELERQLKEPGSPHPVNAKILTYEDAADWDAYRAIGTPEELQEMKKDFAEALSDWRQYRKIGTLEECRAAMEKQTAKKVKSISQVKDGDSYVGLIGRCPCCGDILEEDTVYCDCGQRLDWSRDVKGEETEKNEENT